MKCVLLPLLAATLVAAMPAATAFAQSTGDTTGTATITGGQLILGSVGAVSFSGTLNGLDQTLTSSNSLAVTDATGSGNGWNLTVVGTQFTTGGGAPHVLAATALTITGVTAAASGTGTVTTPTNGVTYPFVVPASTATKFFNAAANTGMGAFDLTASYNVSVPASAFAGNYTSTLTVSLVAGP
jgi:hypothetical protein